MLPHDSHMHHNPSSQLHAHSPSRFGLLFIEFTSTGSLGQCIFGLVTIISICFTYTALSHSMTFSSILITHANTSLTPAPLCHLPKSFTPHVLPFSSPFVDLALYLPTYSLHSLPIPIPPLLQPSPVSFLPYTSPSTISSLLHHAKHSR